MVLVNIHIPLPCPRWVSKLLLAPHFPVLSNDRLADDHAQKQARCNAGTPKELLWANRLESGDNQPAVGHFLAIEYAEYQSMF